MSRPTIAAIALAGLILGTPVNAQQAGPGQENKPSAERGPGYGPGGQRGYGWGPGLMMGRGMMGWGGGGILPAGFFRPARPDVWRPSRSGSTPC